MDFSRVKAALEARGFAVTACASKADAAAYLNGQIDGTSVGFGGSMTLAELGLYDSLSAHNTVYSHWNGGAREAAATADVYLCSVNALAETGELVNIDGAGNRVAGTLNGHRKVYLVVGRNKLAPTYDEALWRARNVAAPKNARRLGVRTPCAVRGDRCYDCKSPERICRGLSVLWTKPGAEECEVVLIGEELGY